MNHRRCRCLNCILPPHILERLLDCEDPKIKQAARRTLQTTARLRGVRSIFAKMDLAKPGNARRSIYDCKGQERLAGATLARNEGGAVARDPAVNRAYDGLGATREFYSKIFARDSIDGRGMRLDGYVHFGEDFNNALWDGREMIFGDGDGIVFTDLTKSLDVIGHELTHGVTEYTAGLEYHKESGALNESISDVFGSMIKQWAAPKPQRAEEADWLIGVEIFTPDIKVDALRSMIDPGGAYKNTPIGDDPQAGHMDQYREERPNWPDIERGDWGGVHIFSGIPNKAFYETAVAIGGYSWERAGRIWYESLLASNSTTDFLGFAGMTYLIAGKIYGANSREQDAVGAGWDAVGIQVAADKTYSKTREQALPGARGGSGYPAGTAVSYESVLKQLDTLAAQVRELTQNVNALTASDGGRLGKAQVAPEEQSALAN